MILAVDFDGVIHDPSTAPYGKRMGRPVEGCKEALSEFRNSSVIPLNHIVIWTARVRNEGDKKHVIDWLNYFEIPYDSISIYKPMADVYLDDKAVHFKDWESALKSLRVIQKSPYHQIEQPEY